MARSITELRHEIARAITEHLHADSAARVADHALGYPDKPLDLTHARRAPIVVTAMIGQSVERETAS
jgi:hypothetical protein